MLEDMQQALDRVPPDLLAFFKIQKMHELKDDSDSPGTTESDYVSLIFN